MRRIMHACVERAIVFIVFALVFLTACQDQPQQAVEPEPSVVTVQIPLKQEAPAAVKPEAVVPTKQEAPAAVKPEAVIPTKQEAPAAVKPEAVVPPKQEAPAAAKPETAVPPKQEAPAAVKPETAVPPKQETPAAVKPETAVPPKLETPAAVKPETAVPPKQETPAAVKPEAVVPPKQEVAKRTKEEAVSPEEPAVAEPAPPQFYSAKGKIDPFLPLIRPKEKLAARTDLKEKKPKRVLTPLEKFDLSQIRLVAVVLAESGNVAMVEEASGKGYVVRVGTYIGKNEGKVEKILKDRILIKEIVKNFRGDDVPRSREMKLHKQEIEG